MRSALRPWFSPVGMILALVMSIVSTDVLARASQARDRVPPTAPTSLVVTAVTSHSVSLAWGASSDNSRRFEYLICCTETTVTVPQSRTRHTIEGLHAGATYVLRAYAKDAAGNLSGSSNAVTVTLPGDVAGPTKPELAPLEVGPTHATLAWLSTDDKLPIWYTIFQDGKAIGTLSSTSSTVAPLEQTTTYMFAVQARDIDGNLSPLSDPIAITTAAPNPNDHMPPTQPTNVTAEDQGLILVRWSPSVDDVTRQALIRYDVFLNGVRSAVVAGQTSVEVDPVPGVNTITVVASDESDNESLPGSATIVFP